MTNWTRSIKGTVLFGAMGLLAGCSAPAHHVLQTNGPLMKDLYQRGADGVSSDAMKYSAQQSMAFQNTLYPQYEAYTRDAANEINQLFPQHKNPTITIYVYPHLASKNNMPVPGYTTATQLYKANQYALPSELVPAQQATPYGADSPSHDSRTILNGSASAREQ